MGFLECNRSFKTNGFIFFVGQRFKIVSDKFQTVTIATPIGKTVVSYELINDGVFKFVY